MTTPHAEFTVRRANADDLPKIFELARRSLGWDIGSETEPHFAWKHFENPFGVSPMWVAEAGERLAGFRTFLRWEFTTPNGELRRAVRAVDTATDPDFQGRGVFTTLTRGAIEELQGDGVDFVFNTPNDQSRPGYLKLGWQVIAQLPIAVRPCGATGIVKTVRARTPATRRGAVASTAGVAAAEVFTDQHLVERLLDRTPTPSGLATHRTPSYLAWRYGSEALHYRVMAAPDGIAAGAGVFHLRRRGPATEAVVCDLLGATDDARSVRAVYAAIARESGADYLLRLRSPGERLLAHRFWPAPGVGPTLTGRALNRLPPADLGEWRLTTGDIELF